MNPSDQIVTARRKVQEGMVREIAELMRHARQFGSVPSPQQIESGGVELILGSALRLATMDGQLSVLEQLSQQLGKV